MDKLNLPQKLASVGVAAFATAGSILVASSANAALFEVGAPPNTLCSATSLVCSGSLDDFIISPTIIGDKEFEYVDHTGLLGGDDFLEVLRTGDDYELIYEFETTPEDILNFTFDYDVTVLDPNRGIDRVDLDTTVLVFDPDEELVTDFNSTTLVSTAGDAVEEPLIPLSGFVEVRNTYTGVAGTPSTEIASFENSFEQNGTVPEPATILGLLAVGGLGLGLKRKKQSTVES